MSKNLSPVQNTEEAKRRGAAGGKKSGEARRQRKALRERLAALLETKHGDMDMADALALALIEKGLAGSVRAFEVIRDTIGEKPTDKVEVDEPPRAIRIVLVGSDGNGRPLER